MYVQRLCKFTLRHWRLVLAVAAIAGEFACLLQLCWVTHDLIGIYLIATAWGRDVWPVLDKDHLVKAIEYLHVIR